MDLAHWLLLCAPLWKFGLDLLRAFKVHPLDWTYDWTQKRHHPSTERD